ncbi:MAG: sigma-70 family RNA polymerase sigma factor [Bacteroidaceae bacterium]|jgi:RNA polymerase sigma-70 factor (ECF subfamily)|nr:sigma-70 family RNA polymerase sigma factor [Bacteroidaceae bacterium]MBQ2456903.1 sigma-70 family RNA polymerase sigma factor [Bacteroidaceae bacterium]
MENIELQFTRMVKEYRKTIYTVCYFFSKDTEEVNDLYQEILINLWKGFPNYRGESSLKTWIWRVSLNTCSNQERKKKSRIRTVPLSIDIDLYNDEDAGSRQIQMLYDRINRLDVFDRAIILLWLENMTYQDIADVVGISVSNVTTRLFRIKEQLKTMSNK